MKYITRPREIEAQQFIIGQPLPEGVSIDFGCAFLDTHIGGPVLLYDGDFVIKEGSKFYKMGPDEFNRLYEPVVISGTNLSIDRQTEDRTFGATQ